MKDISNLGSAERSAAPKLEVLICTFGAEGIKRVAESVHPQIPGVGYLVSWQMPDGEPTVEIPANLLRRQDFRILKVDSRGLSKNRNAALHAATGEVCLIADDDVSYSPEGLLAVMRVFDNNPQLGVAAFRYVDEKGYYQKWYPTEECDLRRPAKGYFVTSFEIAFRLECQRDSHVWFNENFGIGAKFGAGEENIWLCDLLRCGKMSGSYFPVTIARHEGPTTGRRNGEGKTGIYIKGATFIHLHPWSWPLRMVAHALRNRKVPNAPLSTRAYLMAWLKGAADALRLRS